MGIIVSELDIVCGSLKEVSTASYHHGRHEDAFVQKVIQKYGLERQEEGLQKQEEKLQEQEKDLQKQKVEHNQPLIFSVASKKSFTDYGQNKQNSIKQANSFLSLSLIKIKLNPEPSVTSNDPSKQYILRTIKTYPEHEIYPLLQHYIKPTNKTIKYRNTINMLEHNKTRLGNFCRSTYQIQALFEYIGNYTLTDEINLRMQAVSMQSEGQSKQLSLCSSSVSRWDFSRFELIKIFKFMLETAVQLKQNGHAYPVFSLSDILISNQHHTLKYRHPIDSLLRSEIKQFRCHQQAIECGSEKQSLFSFGMCMISLCMLSDLSDCYDYYHHQLCISIMEQRIEQMRCKHRNVDYWLSLCQVIEEMVAPESELRIDYSQISKHLGYIVRQLQVHELSRHNTSSQNVLSDISTCCHRRNKGMWTFNKLSKNVNEVLKPSWSINTLSCHKQKIAISHAQPLESGRSESKQRTGRKNAENNSRRAPLPQPYKLCAKKSKNSDKIKHLASINIYPQHTNRYHNIDERWKIEDEVFRNMPEYHNEQLESISDREKDNAPHHHHSQTLITYRAKDM